jgi:toxin ParE1/3/4
MTARFNVLPAADRDLDDQADYLAREGSLETAYRFYDAANAAFATGRHAGPRRDATVCGIDVIRVLHGARDIDSLLDSDYVI